MSRKYPPPATLADRNKFYGHSPNRKGKGDWQSAFDHTHGYMAPDGIPGVALMARESARFFQMEHRAYLSGILHDLGKYSPTFTDYLNGVDLKLNHWLAGAWVARKRYQADDVALVIEGHHIGLKCGEETSLRRINLTKPLEKEVSLTETNDPQATRLLERLTADLAAHDIVLPPFDSLEPMPDPEERQASAMLGVRMLFSTVVDADYLDTERHFSVGDDFKTPRPKGVKLDAERALKHVTAYLNGLAKEDVPEELQALRRTLGNDCVAAAKEDDLLRILTAPTGSGKTLAMLLYALHRAAREPERFRRIVVALPYLSILDQTAGIYDKLFPKDKFGQHYVLEHHSLAGVPRPSDDPETEEQDRQTDKRTDDQAQAEARLLTENWAAPIILTTNVQLFESLHANKPSACRKLHNLAGSIILCDEVQTLPTHLAIPTLQTLSALATPTYNTAVVFATATQPAFNALHAEVAKDAGTSGWSPREIVAKSRDMFEEAAKLRPVRADWTHADTPTPWTTVAEWLKEEKQGMAIVNLRAHSLELAKLLREDKTEGLEYISTYLCPAHRREVLKRVNMALNRKNSKPCRLVATQCVEAGVDLDFPLVCRALAPLDAIAQASGRCNRNGLIDIAGGLLRVFLPEGDPNHLYPLGGYKQAADLTGILARRPCGINIADPKEYEEYFRTLYVLTDIANSPKSELLRSSIEGLDFENTAKEYRLIDQRGINIIVPYNEQAKEICGEIDKFSLNRDRIRKAREFTVSMFLEKNGQVPDGVRQLTMESTGAVAPDWYLLEVPGLYDKTFGLSPQNGKRSESAGGALRYGRTAYGLD